MQRPRYHFHLLLHAGHLIEEKLRLGLKPLGVLPRQARILDALERMQGASQIELAREFSLSAASMSTMTSRLVRAGFIAREPDRQEPRSHRLTLTRRGRDLLEAIHAVWADVDRALDDALGSEDATTLGGLALRLRNALGGRTPGGHHWKARQNASSPPET